MRITNKIEEYIKGRSGRSQMVMKNAAGSLAIKCVSIILGFVQVPIYLSFLDSSHYGVYLTIASIVAWTQQFDFGLGTGLRYKLTQAISLKDLERGKQLVSTAYISMSLIMLIVLSLCIPLSFFLNWGSILNCDFIGTTELIICVIIVLAVFVVQFVLELIIVVLQADQRSAISSLFKPLANIVSIATVLIMRLYYHNSLFLACLALTIPILLVLFVTNVILYHKRYKRIAPSFKDFKWDCIRDIYSLGIKFFIGQLSSLIIFSTASFLLSHYVAPAETTVYNTAWAYFGFVVSINVMVLQPLVAAITDAYVKNEMAWVKNIFKKISLYSTALSLLEIALLIISPFVFKIWLGDRLVIPVGLCIAMTIYFIFNVWANPYNNFTSGVGKLTVGLILSIVKIIVFFPIAIPLIKMWHAVGLMIAILIVNTIPNMIFGITQYSLIINNKAKGIWNK